MKYAVLLPYETDVSAANVDLATSQTLFDFYETGHDLSLLTWKENHSFWLKSSGNLLKLTPKNIVDECEVVER